MYVFTVNYALRLSPLNPRLFVVNYKQEVYLGVEKLPRGFGRGNWFLWHSICGKQ